jgi:hypothetical protein
MERDDIRAAVKAGIARSRANPGGDTPEQAAIRRLIRGYAAEVRDETARRSRLVMLLKRVTVLEEYLSAVRSGRLVLGAAGGSLTVIRSFPSPASPSAVRGIDVKGRKVEFVASTAALDRHGTIIKPEGIRIENYLRNPIFLWAHDGYGGCFQAPKIENVIGHAERVWKTPEAMRALMKFDEDPTSELAFSKVRSGSLRSLSIGVIPLAGKPEKINGQPVEVITESELLEISLVPIPSNPEALRS